MKLLLSKFALKASTQEKIKPILKTDLIKNKSIQTFKK